jgi:4-amino-4-deoxy-L-arabinose transferase-like glycosyltransferase
MRILRNISPLPIVILMVFVLFAGWLGSRGINEPDEGRYSEIGREMALQSDWLLPHLNGIPHFQKPPLTYWLTATSIRLFGVNEWAVRLTPALAAFGTVLCTMLIAGILYGQACRWKAGLVLSVSLLFFGLARIITTDMLLTFWITAAIAGLVAFVWQGKKTGLVFFYLAMGLGFLTKGPLGILIPTFAGIGIQAGGRLNHKPVPRLYWLFGIPATLLIGLSWYLAMVHRDKSLFDYFFRYEFIDRVATNTHNRSKPFWFYPGVLALGLIPWTGFAIVMVRDLWQRRRQLSAVNYSLFGGWLVAPYIILTLTSSKLATYMLPLMPPLAIMIARWFEHPATGNRWRLPARITALSLSILLMAIPVFIRIFDESQLSLWHLHMIFLISILAAILSLLSLMIAMSKISLPCFLFWMATTWGAAMLSLTTQADTLMTGGNSSVRKAAAYIRQADPDKKAVVMVFATRSHGMEFYLQRLVSRGYSKSDVVLPLTKEQHQRIVIDEEETVRSFTNVPAFVFTKESNYNRYPCFADWKIIMHTGRSVLLGNPQALAMTNAH